MQPHCGGRRDEHRNKTGEGNAGGGQMPRQDKRQALVKRWSQFHRWTEGRFQNVVLALAPRAFVIRNCESVTGCLLYTSDAADDTPC
eukprot:335446-Pyramimonas_sp.AAC.1